jgi:phenylacetic acid degradation operon negative regulatory protein
VAGLFGVNEGTARVALSRMAAAGEVEAVEGRYRLAGHLLARQARQRESRSPQLRRWKGAWALVVVTAVRRTAAARAEARRSLLAARLAELREGVWVRPDNLDVVVPSEVAGHVERWTARPEGDPVALARGLWPLGEWAERAERLLDRMAATLPTLQPGHTEVLAPGFVLSAAVLRHFQADPLLPAELLPEDWPGDALRHEYDAWDAAYRQVLIGYHRGHVTPA